MQITTKNICPIIYIFFLSFRLYMTLILLLHSGSTSTSVLCSFKITTKTKILLISFLVLLLFGFILFSLSVYDYYRLGCHIFMFYFDQDLATIVIHLLDIYMFTWPNCPTVCTIMNNIFQC
jgi:hypothetical protein